ncbi:hypothetical protein ACFSCW_05920 [Sphingomonas tabacisoli]|uniref:Uncharacterized protein n=1 Tax=Sphingomonas tabacisoli TaxID=2249466 RepID=A0ABW4I083_9SPHN
MRTFLLIALLAGAPALADTPSTTTSQPGADKDKMICRRETPVGSLIASRKICLTKAQWDARAVDSQDAAQRMVDENRARPGGN